MGYKNLEQLLALSKTGTRDAGVEIPPFPKLTGRLASIDPQGVEQFNAAVMEWVQQFSVKARQQEFEQNLTATTSSIVTSPTDVTGVKGDKGDKGDSVKGDKGDIGATGATENLENLFANILTDGSNVLVGSAGNVLTGALV